MRDNFRPNVRLTTNILMVMGTFLIAFKLSKISTESKEELIRFDCARFNANAIPLKDFNEKYEIPFSVEPYDLYLRSLDSANAFCSYYNRAL